MWELDYKESWALKNWCFWTVVLRRLWRAPWTARRSNQSILKEISPKYSLEGLMPKLKLQYFGHLMQRIDSLEKTLMLGKIEGKRRRGWQRMRWLYEVSFGISPPFILRLWAGVSRDVGLGKNHTLCLILASVRSLAPTLGNILPLARDSLFSLVLITLGCRNLKLEVKSKEMWEQSLGN